MGHPFPRGGMKEISVPARRAIGAPRQYSALAKMAASKVAVFSNLQPVATALAAWAFLGDRLT